MSLANNIIMVCLWASLALGEDNNYQVKAPLLPDGLQDGNLWMDSVPDAIIFWKKLTAEMEKVQKGAEPFRLKEVSENHQTMIIRKDPSQIFGSNLVAIYSFGNPKTATDGTEADGEKFCALQTGQFTGRTLDLVHYGEVAGLDLWGGDLFPEGSTIVLRSSSTGSDADDYLEAGDKLDQIKGNFSLPNFQFVLTKSEGLKSVSNTDTRGKVLCREKLRMGYLEILKTILYPEREASNAAIYMKFMPAWMQPLWLNAATTNQHLQRLKVVKEEVDGEDEEQETPEEDNEDPEEENEVPDEGNEGEEGTYEGGDEAEQGDDEETENETKTKPTKKGTDGSPKKGSGREEKDGQVLLQGGPGF